MLEIELEAGISHELARRQSERLELDRTAAHTERCLEHRRDFRGEHGRVEVRHLLLVAAALLNERLVVRQASNEGDAVEKRAVERPVLDPAHIVEEEAA